MTFDAEAAEHEDGDAEIEPDDEQDDPPVLLEIGRPNVIRRWAPRPRPASAMP